MPQLLILPLAIISFLGLIFTIPPKSLYAAEDSNALLVKINQFRQSKGLPAMNTDPLTCNFARLRAQEISTDFSHNGFYNRISNKTLPYSGYKLVTENLARVPKGRDVINMWINSPGHQANLLKNTRFACVESYGNFYAYEGRS
ncbi:MAG: CAP domain-containing protein [Candidatus Daviesbacteria bacterium]|nr:CAP domain-containing protein [Candidatus Daviesbacteria bacterium]